MLKQICSDEIIAGSLYDMKTKMLVVNIETKPRWQDKPHRDKFDRRKILMDTSDEQDNTSTYVRVIFLGPLHNSDLRVIFLGQLHNSD